MLKPGRPSRAAEERGRRWSGRAPRPRLSKAEKASMKAELRRARLKCPRSPWPPDALAAEGRRVPEVEGEGSRPPKRLRKMSSGLRKV